MKIIKDSNVNFPIYYIAIAIILGSIFYGLYMTNWYLAVISAGCFFYCSYRLTNKVFIIFIFIFFLLQLVINFNYYNFSIGNRVNDITFRVKENKGYYYLAEYKGRSFTLTNIQSDVKCGEDLRIKGTYKENCDYEKGILGDIKVSSYVKEEDSYIRKLYYLRESLYSKLRENIGDRKAGLVMSVALGYTEALSNEDDSDMGDIGIIHAVSVSGLHVAIIFAVAKKLLRSEYALIVTGIYVLITGAAFSSLRAFIMLIIFALAIKARRNYNPLAAMLVSAAIILILKPYAIFKVGFQLSYMAVLGIILFNKLINRKLFLLPEYLKSNISISISAQIFTTPILILYFSEVSFIAVIANLLLDKVIFALVIVGNLLLITMPIDAVFDFLSFLSIKIINILDYFVDMIIGYSEIGIAGNEIVAIMYVIMIMSFYFIYKGNKTFIKLLAVTLIVFSIYAYSPVLRIKNYDNEGIVISYRGENSLIYKKSKNLKKIKNKHGANESYNIDDTRLLYNRVLINKGKIGIKKDNERFEVIDKEDIGERYVF